MVMIAESCFLLSLSNFGCELNFRKRFILKQFIMVQSVTSFKMLPDLPGLRLAGVLFVYPKLASFFLILLPYPPHTLACVLFHLFAHLLCGLRYAVPPNRFYRPNILSRGYGHCTGLLPQPRVRGEVVAGLFRLLRAPRNRMWFKLLKSSKMSMM